MSIINKILPTPHHKLAWSIGVSLASLSVAIAMPTDATVQLGFGQSRVNLTPVKNSVIVGLGLASTWMFLQGIKYLDQIEDAQEVEREEMRQRLLAEQQRNALIAEAESNAQYQFHKAVAERSVQKAFQQHLAAEQSIPAPVAAQAVTAGVQGIQSTAISPDPLTPSAQPTAKGPQPENIAEKLGANPKCFMILGVPGSGKAMVTTNAFRFLKKVKPHIKTVFIDPKADPKETGNLDEGIDVVFRKRAEQLDNHTFLKWIKGCIEYFKKLPDGKLLIFDEITSTFTRWSRLDKQSFEAFMVDYCTYLSSSGDSMENYVWLIGQVPHASALGIDGGIRSIYKPVAIVSNHDRRATDTFLGTKWIPKPPGGIQEVYNIMDRSPRGRAMYDYTEDRWIPMPELKNYSGFDRDTRTHLS